MEVAPCSDTRGAQQGRWGDSGLATTFFLLSNGGTRRVDPTLWSMKLACRAHQCPFDLGGRYRTFHGPAPPSTLWQVFSVSGTISSLNTRASVETLRPHSQTTPAPAWERARGGSWGTHGHTWSKPRRGMLLIMTVVSNPRPVRNPAHSRATSARG